jgi:hypothetical protein
VSEIRLPNRTDAVDHVLQALDHPLKEEIERIRLSILRSNDQITEHIKWNAPSFCYQGDDRVTFRLHPGNRIQLVFHRGAKATKDADFAFEDHTGVLAWLAPDRAIVTFHDMAEVTAKQDALVRVVK